MASKTLTPAQEQELFDNSKAKLDKLSKGFYKKSDEEITQDFVKLYHLCGWTKPEVFIVDSPAAAQALAKKELEQESDDPVPYSTYINFSDKGWMTYFETLKDHFPEEVTQEEIDNVKLLDEITNGCFACILFEDAAIAVRYPEEIGLNEEFQLHATSKPAVRFPDGFEQAFIRGRKMEIEDFYKCQTIEGAKEFFFGTDNEDYKAMCIDIVKSNFGDKGVMDMLGAVVVDEAMIAHDTGQVETVKLLKTTESYSILSDRFGDFGQPYCWVLYKCPSTEFEYYITCSADFTSALEAAKFMRPNYIPMELEYNWESFRN